jgi:hypothetical protein
MERDKREQKVQKEAGSAKGNQERKRKTGVQKYEDEKARRAGA